MRKATIGPYICMLGSQSVNCSGKIGKCGLVLGVSMGWALRFQKPPPVPVSLPACLPVGQDVSSEPLVCLPATMLPALIRMD